MGEDIIRIAHWELPTGPPWGPAMRVEFDNGQASQMAEMYSAPTGWSRASSVSTATYTVFPSPKWRLSC